MENVAWAWHRETVHHREDRETSEKAENVERIIKPHHEKSKKISNDQESIQSDPTSCPQNQKGYNKIYKMTAVYKRNSR